MVNWHDEIISTFCIFNFALYLLVMTHSLTLVALSSNLRVLKFFPCHLR